MKDKPDPRHNLPKRRLTVTRRIETPEGHTIHLSVGYDPNEDGRSQRHRAAIRPLPRRSLRSEQTGKMRTLCAFAASAKKPTLGRTHRHQGREAVVRCLGEISLPPSHIRTIGYSLVADAAVP